MTLAEGLTVLGVLATFAYLIMAKVNERNTSLMKKIKSWFKEKEEKVPEIKGLDEFSRQTWQEKRTIM